jgi:hypothetical protein
LEIGDKLKNALFGDLSLEEAMDLSGERQILEIELPFPRTPSRRGALLVLLIYWRSNLAWILASTMVS